MKNLKLQRVIDLQSLVLKLRDVKRITYNPGAGYENDVEHSFSMAFIAWLMLPRVAPHLDFYRVQTYAMIHDLVEVYAGDTFCFADEKSLANKAVREDDARYKLCNEFFDFPQLVEALNDYESLRNEEARFVCALDKLQGIIINYLDGGRVWHENNITFDEMFTNKLGKTAIHPEIHKYVIEISYLMRNEPDIFPTSEKFKAISAVS